MNWRFYFYPVTRGWLTNAKALNFSTITAACLTGRLQWQAGGGGTDTQPTGAVIRPECWDGSSPLLTSLSSPPASLLPRLLRARLGSQSALNVNTTQIVPGPADWRRHFVSLSSSLRRLHGGIVMKRVYGSIFWLQAFLLEEKSKQVKNVDARQIYIINWGPDEAATRFLAVTGLCSNLRMRRGKRKRHPEPRIIYFNRERIKNIAIILGHLTKLI